MPPDDNKIDALWSPDDDNEDMEITTTDEEGEDTDDTSSEDEDMGISTINEESEDTEDTSSEDEASDDMIKIYIYKNELRSTQFMTLNTSKIDEAWPSNYEMEDSEDMPPDDVSDNDESASSYNEDGSMRKKSSDSKSIENMVESYTPGESKLTQIKPLNNKQRYEACSSIHKNKDRGDTTSNFEDKNMRDTPADFEDETMRDASSNFEDEAMRDESSQDGESNDVDRPPAGENELRLS